MKLRQLEELPGLIAGKRAVVAHGCFDILRAEHLRHLEGVRRRGDLLVVAVYDDRSPSATNGLPILNAAERVALISALRCVDYAVVIDELQVGHMLDVLQPVASEKEPPTSDVVRRIQQIHESPGRP